jgi:hypothetical protein
MSRVLIVDQPLKESFFLKDKHHSTILMYILSLLAGNPPHNKSRFTATLPGKRGYYNLYIVIVSSNVFHVVQGFYSLLLLFAAVLRVDD